jgi:hypothetical protein
VATSYTSDATTVGEDQNWLLTAKTSKFLLTLDEHEDVERTQAGIPFAQRITHQDGEYVAYSNEIHAITWSYATLVKANANDKVRLHERSNRHRFCTIEQLNKEFQRNNTTTPTTK